MLKLDMDGLFKIQYAAITNVALGELYQLRNYISSIELFPTNSIEIFMDAIYRYIHNNCDATMKYSVDSIDPNNFSIMALRDSVIEYLDNTTGEKYWFSCTNYPLQEFVMFIDENGCIQSLALDLNRKGDMTFTIIDSDNKVIVNKNHKSSFETFENGCVAVILVKEVIESNIPTRKPYWYERLLRKQPKYINMIQYRLYVSDSYEAYFDDDEETEEEEIRKAKRTSDLKSLQYLIAKEWCKMIESGEGHMEFKIEGINTHGNPENQ